MSKGKQCPKCGFLIITFGGPVPDKCPKCNTEIKK